MKRRQVKDDDDDASERDDMNSSRSSSNHERSSSSTISIVRSSSLTKNNAPLRSARARSLKRHSAHRRHALAGEHPQMNLGQQKGRRNILKQLGTFIKKKVGKKSARKKLDVRKKTGSHTSIESYASVVYLRDKLDDVSELGPSSRVRRILSRVKSAIGVSELMRELRLKREEYARKMEDILHARRSSGKITEDHPYVALRRKIEAMAVAESNSYSIDYRPFSNRAHIRDVGIPVYASDYNNERKKQARRRQFMFGLRKDDRYDFDAEQIDEYADDPKHHSDQTWSSKRETDLTVLAMIFSAANLIRFPHACYINGGIVFFFVYCLLIVTLIQPLILFEMLIGQFSFKGEYGFSHLHKCARGFSYAILFVNITFITLQNAMAGYTGLYTIGSILIHPGQCHFTEWGNRSECIPYSTVEDFHAVLNQRSIWLEQNLITDRETLYNANVYLSTEIFFKFYIYNWKSKSGKDTFHWRFVLVFLFILICIFPSSIQTYLASTFSKVWIHLACVLPIILTLILFHQYAFRGGSKIPPYFSKFKWERMSTLVFWCDAFEMALTTVGVGFGGLVRISARNDFKFQKLRRLSWLMSITVMGFCLLCALVVFTELGILGEITKSKEYIHVIAEGFGVSFVCLSGALLKIGPRPVWILAITFGWIAIFNIWSLIVSAQMGISYVRHWLPLKSMNLRKFVSLVISISVQMGVVSVYIVHADFAETDSFDLFGGSGAACVMLAVEMGIAFVLCGFREFMTDIEIMLDIPMTFAFQVQMHYYAPVSIGIAYFVIAVSWFFNPPRHRHTKNGVQHISPTTFWIGFVVNAIPILIVVIFGYWGFQTSRKKVVPRNENNKILEKKKDVKTFWTLQARQGRRAAVTATHTGAAEHLSVFAIFKDSNLAHKLAQHELKLAYNTHIALRDRLREFYRFRKARVAWIQIVDKILAKLPLKSIVNATKVVLRHNELQTTTKEVSFLRRMIHQCSVVDLGKCIQSKMQEQEFEDQEIFLLDNLIENTSLYSQDSDSDESVEEEVNPFTSNTPPKRQSNYDLDDVVHSTSTMESGNTSVYRRVVGKPKKSDEEVRLDFAVRIRRGIDLPYQKKMEELTYLREERFRKEREIIQRYDGPPQEFFITVRIARKDEEPFLAGFRVIVLPHQDHFVIKRLPFPRPPIVYTTRSYLNTYYKADTLNQQIFELAIFTLKQKLWQSNLTTLLRPSNRVSLMDNLNDEVYSFIEPDKSCIIVLEDEHMANLRKNVWRWLTPTLRRKPPPPPQEEVQHQFTFDYEEVTMIDLMEREEERQRKESILNEPSDILYRHSSGEIFHHDKQTYSTHSLLVPVRSDTGGSSGRSSGSNSPTASDHLLTENMMTEIFGGHSGTATDIHVPHLTGSDWKRRKAQFQIPVVLINEGKNPSAIKSRSDTTGYKFAVREATFDDDNGEADGMSMLPLLGKGTRAKPKSLSDRLFSSLHDTSISSRAITDFSNLKNDYPNYWYYSDGKTLVILKRSDDKFSLASHEDSIASAVLPTTSSFKFRKPSASRKASDTISKSKTNISKRKSKSKNKMK